jgi:cytochrome c556
MRARAVGPCLGAVLLLRGAFAVAHEGAVGIVKERMDAMEAMAKSMKAIGERLKANCELGAIQVEAENIHRLSQHIAHMYPPGSTQHPTHAKGAIWKNWSDFEAKARALETESAKLATTGPSDLGALRSQLRAMSQTCSACHEKYRVTK